MSLVSQFTPRSLDTSDKQHLLTDFVDLTSNASAIALNAKKTSFDAVQAFEFDCELITGFLNKIRIDIFDFQQKYP